MKSIRMIIAIIVGAAAFAAVPALTAFSQSTRETTVKSLDSMDISGGTLNYSYTVSSNCPAGSHNNSIIITTTSRQKVVDSFVIKIVDRTSDSRCKNAINAVSVSGSKDLASEIRTKTNEMINTGYRIAPDATFVLPAVRIAALNNTNYSNGGGTRPDWHNNNGNNNSNQPSMVSVVVVGYTPAWRCTLYKNDSSRTDGFEGTGTTIEEARRNASTRCRTTNNPNCDVYSNSPDHTTCDVQYQETTKIVQYDSNNVPPGVTSDSWNCVLNKNDGLSAGSDGFRGLGRTQDAARADAANKCGATNNPRCNNYSTDSGHTLCAQQMVMYGPKPSAVWNCSLRKNDGSRNDGFAGTGSTEADARRNTITGCQGTNNPNCSNYSKDPAHTQCTVAFNYPQ